ncbi:MAG: MFS transporter [Eubacterium sp.]|nr:MFS transporter [Eubacterium sp.]
MEKRLSAREKFSYGAGAVGKDMVYALTATYILYYYQDLLGINPVYMGIILLAARVFDAFNDPIMGIIVAKTKTRFGRFRPWLLIGTILNSVFLILLFAVPSGMSASGLIAYASVFYIMWGTTYTMMDIPYWSMVPAFTNVGKERENVSAMARSCAGAGSALIQIFTMIIVPVVGAFGLDGAKAAMDRFGVTEVTDKMVTTVTEINGFFWIAVIVAAIFLITTLLTCINIKEKSSVEMKAASVKQMFKALFSNDQAMVVVITIVLVNTAFYITSNLVIYFFKYDFGGADWNGSYTLFNMFGGAIQILSMMILFPILRRFFNLIRLFKISLIMSVVGYGTLLLIAFTAMNNVFILFVPGLFIFSANGLLTVMTTVFLANTVDYGEFKNGRRDESVIFSMQTFVVKLASGLAALVASIALAVFNISNDTGAAETAGTSSVVGLRMVMVIIPVAGLLIALLIFGKKYILTDEKLKEIIVENMKKQPTPPSE